MSTDTGRQPGEGVVVAVDTLPEPIPVEWHHPANVEDDGYVVAWAFCSTGEVLPYMATRREPRPHLERDPEAWRFYA